MAGPGDGVLCLEAAILYPGSVHVRRPHPEHLLSFKSGLALCCFGGRDVVRIETNRPDVSFPWRSQRPPPSQTALLTLALRKRVLVSRYPTEPYEGDIALDGTAVKLVELSFGAGIARVMRKWSAFLSPHHFDTNALVTLDDFAQYTLLRVCRAGMSRRSHTDKMFCKAGQVHDYCTDRTDVPKDGVLIRHDDGGMWNVAGGVESRLASVEVPPALMKHLGSLLESEVCAPGQINAKWVHAAISKIFHGSILFDTFQFAYKVRFGRD